MFTSNSSGFGLAKLYKPVGTSPVYKGGLLTLSRGLPEGFEGLTSTNPQPTLNQPSGNPQATPSEPPLKMVDTLDELRTLLERKPNVFISGIFIIR
jgi:hypothetical protein